MIKGNNKPEKYSDPVTYSSLKVQERHTSVKEIKRNLNLGVVFEVKPLW